MAVALVYVFSVRFHDYMSAIQNMSDDEYEVPLQDQRVFGAGIKRKRVHFIPSSITSPPVVPSPSSREVADAYLKVVLPSASKSTETRPTPPSNSESPRICEVCSLPLSDQGSPSSREKNPSQRPHEASLAHQVCLSHSHPPSHLDRGRKGLVYLSQYGWDPDSRLGLGVEGQGIRAPIKTKVKDDKLGIGVVLPKEVVKVKKLGKLDAGKVRKMQEREKRTAESLRQAFYGNEDVERYLGHG